MSFDIKVEKHAREAVLMVYGEIDLYTAPDLYDHLRELVEDNTICTVFVDLQNCPYFDSEGIKALIKVIRTAQNQTNIIIDGVIPRVRRVFELSGLSRIIKINPLAA